MSEPADTSRLPKEIAAVNTLIESSFSHVRRSRCRNAAHFLSTISTPATATNYYMQAQPQAASATSILHGPPEAGHASSITFHTIILVCSASYRSRFSCFRSVFVTRFGDEDWFSYIFDSSDAFLVDLSENTPPEDRLLAMRSIPPSITSLCLVFADPLESPEERHALVHALNSLPATCTRLLLLGFLFTTMTILGLDNSLMQSLISNKLLTSLTINIPFLLSSHVECLFSSLENHLHLTSLSLKSTNTSGYLYANTRLRTKVLDSLRINGTIHQVELPHPLNLDDAIATQLRKNKENAARVGLLKSEGMEEVRPSTIRLYLCGLPLSGKTTICRTLARWSKGSMSRLGSKFKNIRVSHRTRGIEVNVLKSQCGQRRISIWDMAGQAEYHSFHDAMLPDLNDRATPPLFLYVWNPFKTCKNGKVVRDANGYNVIKSSKQFEDDFAYWLKFIASKSSKSRLLKPKVIVTITREDLRLPDGMIGWLHSASKALQKDFEDYISLDLEEIFHVDARDPKKIAKLASHIFQCAEIILSKAPNDFKIFDITRDIFQKMTHNKEIPPLISKEKFLSLSRRQLGIESHDMYEAIALSLSCSGDLIYFPSFELVVTNTRWFCEKIMGDLIYFNVNSIHSREGFFPRLSLESTLEEVTSRALISKRKVTIWRRKLSKSQESLKVSGSAIVKLLMSMRLACLRDYSQDDSDIFIPASLCGTASRRISPSTYLKLDGLSESNSFIGRRWAAKDSKCTFLTPGIFPLIQVTFYNTLSSRSIHVDLNQDVMAIGFDGVRVFVEFCRLEGLENFIDVLAVSRQTVDETLRWLDRNVMSEMKIVFADSRGNPGVELVQSVIQPAGIQELMEARDRRAVPVEVLEDCLMRHVHTNGVKPTKDGMESIIYTWQTQPLADDSIVSLLGEVEVRRAVESYKDSLSEAASHVLLNLSTSVIGDESRSRPEFGNTPSHRQRKAIYDKICDVEVRVEEGFRQLADQIKDLRDAVLPELCNLFTFVAEGEAGKLPRMYVLTQDDGTVRRVVSKTVPGLHTVRLELLCECRNRPCHHVNGDHIGLSIATLDDGLLKRGLPYIDAFLKGAYLLVKVGAHVALGLGNSIPDFTRVVAGIIDANQVAGAMPTFSGLTEASPSSLRPDFVRQGQQWLFDVLSHHNCTTGDQIYKQFGLRRVRYADSTVAWVCDTHYSGGVPFPA